MLAVSFVEARIKIMFMPLLGITVAVARVLEDEG